VVDQATDGRAIAQGWRSRLHSRWASAAQLAGTCIVLAFVPGNFAKLAALLVLWALTFGRWSRREAIAGLGVCLIFTAMDVEMLRRGVFAFRDPDWAGLPSWEFVIWGFYVLHAARTLGGYATGGRLALAAVLAIAFSVPFVVIADPFVLAAVSAAMLAIALSTFHHRLDFAYAGYMAFVGLLIEYTGVASGQWRYPDAPAGGVPLWSLPMWAGIGVFVRRIVTPWLRAPDDSVS
jgi:hypothetical protein